MLNIPDDTIKGRSFMLQEFLFQGRRKSCPLSRTIKVMIAPKSTLEFGLLLQSVGERLPTGGVVIRKYLRCHILIQHA